MKVQELREIIKEKFEENSLYLDELEEQYEVKCVCGTEEEVNSYLASIGEPLLTEKQYQCLWRAWGFEVVLEDGPFRFLLWDIGNCNYNFYSELKYKRLSEYIDSIIRKEEEEKRNSGPKSVLELEAATDVNEYI